MLIFNVHRLWGRQVGIAISRKGASFSYDGHSRWNHEINIFEYVTMVNVLNLTLA